MYAEGVSTAFIDEKSFMAQFSCEPTHVSLMQTSLQIITCIFTSKLNKFSDNIINKLSKQ